MQTYEDYKRRATADLQNQPGTPPWELCCWAGARQDLLALPPAAPSAHSHHQPWPSREQGWNIAAGTNQPWGSSSPHLREALNLYNCEHTNVISWAAVQGKGKEHPTTPILNEGRQQNSHHLNVACSIFRPHTFAVSHLNTGCSSGAFISQACTSEKIILC